MSRCRRVQSWIVRSVDGDLRPDEALGLAKHLATCTACRIVLARESRLAEILDGADDGLSVDENFFGAVMASLPDRPVRSTVELARKTRWRRGLRLASWASVGALGAGLAARARGSQPPEDADGLISIIGSAAQWIRMTAQSVTWAGSSGAWGAWTIGALSLSAVLAGLATVLTLSGALAWATRNGSRAS
jgi:anti-sigma factor RsiW